MTDTEDSCGLRTSQTQIHPSEAEVSQLLKEAAQQYEACMRLADLADISEMDEVGHTRYAWDNPIELVVAEWQNAELV